MIQLPLLIITYGALPLLLMPLTGTRIISTTVILALGICLMLHKSTRKTVCAGMQAILQKISDTVGQNAFVRNLAYCLIAAVVTVILAQIMIVTTVFSMGFLKFMWGVLIVLVAILLLYCFFGKIMPSVLLGSGIFMVISTINVYVYRFRGRLFEPVDIFSAGTALNVAENYSLLPIPLSLLIGWGIFAAMLIVLHRLQRENEPGLTWKKRCMLLCICIISSMGIYFYASNLSTYHWHKEGAQFNGYILDFVSKFKEISAPEPENYSTELIAGIADQYDAVHDDHESEGSDYPHIIVIMDEAFSDLSVIGEFSTNTEVIPFISSLKENAVSGYALASVYGGNTANSEYEFLTGNSLAWLSPNVVPYQQYIRSSTYSMVSYLKSSYHYKCVAMHPFYSSGWNRPAAYEHFGFDDCYFVEDFPQTNYVRDYVSDQEMFEFLIQTYEAQKDDPLFILGVTMQNHGGYTYTGENYTKSISLDDHADEFPEVEQYLSLIHETDKAVERLIAYFQSVEEDVVIVFFGDHQPNLDEAFYETISGTAADTLDEQQLRYMVPFFIWANYEIEEKYIDCTSLNYLSSYVYEVAGIALPPYNKFLQEMEKTIPAINANGFYSLEAGCYLPFDKANEKEQRWLGLYETLQYNSIFDNENRDGSFFPVLE